MEIKKISFTFLILVSLLFTKEIREKKININQTSRNVFELSILTVIPSFLYISGSQSEHFKPELYISASIISIPALIGWPLFIREIRKNRRELKLNEYEEYKKTKQKRNEQKLSEDEINAGSDEKEKP